MVKSDTTATDIIVDVESRERPQPRGLEYPVPASTSADAPERYFVQPRVYHATRGHDYTSYKLYEQGRPLELAVIYSETDAEMILDVLNARVHREPSAGLREQARELADIWAQTWPTHEALNLKELQNLADRIARFGAEREDAAREAKEELEQELQSVDNVLEHLDRVWKSGYKTRYARIVEAAYSTEKQVDAAREAQKEADCKAVCEECGRGTFPEVQQTDAGDWIHIRDGIGYWVCKASGIRSLNAEKEESNYGA